MVALAVILLWAAYLVRGVLLLLYISGLLAIGFSPIVRIIERQTLLPIGTRRFPRWLAILILYLAILGALTLIGWTPYARLARGLTKEVNSREFIRAAEVLGMKRRFILFRHIIPNTFRPIAAVSFLRFGHKLITVGGLSFLGLGVQPPNPDWGLMLADAQPYLERAPLLMIAPGAVIFLAALSVTWIGHGMEIDTREPGHSGDRT